MYRPRIKRSTQSVVLLTTVILSALMVVWDNHPDAWAGEPPEEKLDCHVYDTRSGSITVGLKAGNFLFQVGPEVTFGRQRGIAWDKVVQGIIARYKEVCTRYNAGAVTKQEYEQRLREIDGLYREAQELERRLIAETHAHARSAHEEMERQLSGRTAEPQPERDGLSESLQTLSSRIERLDRSASP